METKLALEDLYKHEIEGAIIRSKCEIFEYGEKNSKFFLNPEKQQKNKSAIRKLLIDNVEINDSKEILSNIKIHFSKNYEAKKEVGVTDCRTFLKELDLPVLTEQQSSGCGKLINKNEILAALRKMKNKSPGNDGLQKEFYISYFPIIGDLLLNCLDYCFEQGELAPTQCQAIITLVPKPGKDIRLLKSWRPIRMLNVDTKILSTILVGRAKPLLENIISENQSAFLSKRNISDPIRIISDVLHYCKRKKLNNILFAADFAAAFDSVSHT